MRTITFDRFPNCETGRENGRLGIDGQIELLFGSLKAQFGNLESQNPIRIAKTSAGRFGGFKECFSHADGLSPLPGEKQCERKSFYHLIHTDAQVSPPPKATNTVLDPGVNFLASQASYMATAVEAADILP